MGVPPPISHQHTKTPLMPPAQARIRHVVLDEADLLLTPAYSRATQRILTVGSRLAADTAAGVEARRSAECADGWARMASTKQAHGHGDVSHSKLGYLRADLC